MNVIIEHKNSTRLSEGGPATWIVQHCYFFPYMASTDIELVDYLNGLALLMGKRERSFIIVVRLI